MVKSPKTEEQYKTAIFDIYSKYREEPSSDRRQVYFGQLCDSVFRWCKDYLFYKKGEIGGVEIVEALKRIVKEGNKTPKDENDFFKYLDMALNNAKNEYYRNNKSNIIKLPRIFKNIEKVILLHENNAGRTLSKEEKIQFVSEWFNKPKEKARKYLEIIANKNVGSLTYYNDDEEKDILDSEDLKPPYLPLSLNEPEGTFFSNLDTVLNAAAIRKAVKTVLSNKQDRTRECYRALFTAYCIDKSIDFEGMDTVLNIEILEKYRKDGKKPEQYEIYKMYHPDVKKESAGVRASETLKTFLNDLQAVLKEKI